MVWEVVIDIGAVSDDGVVSDGNSGSDEDIIGQFHSFTDDDIAVMHWVSVENILIRAMGENTASGSHGTLFLQVYES
jgi:hypothetical protein